MACFLVSTAIGIVTTAFRKKFPANWHINWLNLMIFGETIALAIDHFATGEIVPWFPFLTAMNSPAATSTMLEELAKAGIPMAIAVVLAWAAAVLAFEKLLAPSKAGFKAVQ